MQSLWAGLSGLNASSTWLDTIAGNLSNMNTTGFASEGNSFADALTRQMSGQATAPALAGRYTLPGWWAPSGVYATGLESNFSQMSMKSTGVSTDAAIEGNGFFTVRTPSGETLLTKAGSFQWSRQANGSFALATPNGDLVLDTKNQPILAPSKPTSMTIAQDGQITFGDQSGSAALAGPTLQVVDVPVPSQSLIAVSGTNYAVAPGWKAIPAGQYSVHQGFLNESNVNATDELANLVEAQQMYNLNTESLKISNQMMGIANNIL
jgi:flagellar basal-body rod protein FlgG